MMSHTMLIPKIAGVKAMGVESLNALLVGVTKVDRCLTEEKRHGSRFPRLDCFGPNSRDVF